jgi:hypothetical protein
VQIMLCRGFRIRRRLINVRVVLVARLRCVHGRFWLWRGRQHTDLLQWRLSSSKGLLKVAVSKAGSGCLVGVCSIVLAVWSDTLKLQSDTSRTRPSICRRGVALDFSPSAALTRPHHWHNWSVCECAPPVAVIRSSYPSIAYGDCARQRRHSLRGIIRCCWQAIWDA